MVLHPQTRAALERAAAEPSVLDPDYDLQEERAAGRTAALAAPREEVALVRDLVVGGVPVRLHVPAGRPAGVVVHLHGGGFVLNDIDVHDASVRRLANRSGLAVVSVAYRRPPEHPFPAAPDDVSTVVGWLLDGGLDSLDLVGAGLAGVDLPRGLPLLAHGDSAGANLALVAALRHPGAFRAVALIYPFLDPTTNGASYDDAPAGFGRAEARWYWEQYAAAPEDLDHPDLAPLRSDRLHTLPATLVVSAEHDPLRDEAEQLVVRLAELGVPVVGTRYLGMAHGFWRHPDVFDAAEPLMAQVAGFLALHAQSGHAQSGHAQSGDV